MIEAVVVGIVLAYVWACIECKTIIGPRPLVVWAGIVVMYCLDETAKKIFNHPILAAETEDKVYRRIFKT